MQCNIGHDVNGDGSVDKQDEIIENAGEGTGALVGVNNAVNNDGKLNCSNNVIDDTSYKHLQEFKLTMEPESCPEDKADAVLKLKDASDKDHIRVFDQNDEAVIGPNAGTKHQIPHSDWGSAQKYHVEALKSAVTAHLELAITKPGGTSVDSDTLRLHTFKLRCKGAIGLGSLIFKEAKGLQGHKYGISMPEIDRDHPVMALIPINADETRVEFQNNINAQWAATNCLVLPEGINAPELKEFVIKLHRTTSSSLSSSQVMQQIKKEFNISDTKSPKYLLTPKIYNAGSKKISVENVKKNALKITVCRVDLDGYNAQRKNTNKQVPDITEKTKGVFIQDKDTSPNAKLIARSCGISGLTRKIIIHDSEDADNAPDINLLHPFKDINEFSDGSAPIPADSNKEIPVKNIWATTPYSFPIEVELQVLTSNDIVLGSDSVTLRTGILDLDIDSNNVSGFTFEDGECKDRLAEDRIEKNSPKIICVNQDDDDEDGKEDWKDSKVNGNSDFYDMAKMALQCEPNKSYSKTEYSIEITEGADKVRIFDKNKNPIVGKGFDNERRAILEEPLPDNKCLYVEGVKEGEATIRVNWESAKNPDKYITRDLVRVKVNKPGNPVQLRDVDVRWRSQLKFEIEAEADDVLCPINFVQAKKFVHNGGASQGWEKDINPKFTDLYYYNKDIYLPLSDQTWGSTVRPHISYPKRNGLIDAPSARLRVKKSGQYCKFITFVVDERNKLILAALLWEFVVEEHPKNNADWRCLKVREPTDSKIKKVLNSQNSALKGEGLKYNHNIIQNIQGQEKVWLKALP